MSSFSKLKCSLLLPDKIRPTFQCRILKTINLKKYEGHNRAKSAIIEACILASRVKLLEKKKILKELDYLKIAVHKTAGLIEKKSWSKIWKYINDKVEEK